MNVLFITIGRLNSIYEKEIYPDLMRQLSDDGNQITVLRFSADENSETKSGPVVIHNKYLKGIRGSASSVRKGLAYLVFPIKCIQYIHCNSQYDLVIASTPPVTVSFVFKYLKNKRVATYLLQKDIFPEDAIDLGVLKKQGIKGLIYKFFRRCENNLYRDSSFIGAMSQGCVEYLITHNSNVDYRKFEVNPNSIIPSNYRITGKEKKELRNKFDLPEDKVVFVYGGNISDAQGLDFIDSVLDKIDNIEGALFLFLGEGNGFDYLKQKYSGKEQVCFRPAIASKDYYLLVGCCDVGLVFLSNKLSVPNVPSRLLFYMDNYLPVLAAVDQVSDIYQTINNEKFGICCHSTETELNLFIDGATSLLDKNERYVMGERAKAYLVKNWSCKESLKIIKSHFGEEK